MEINYNYWERAQKILAKKRYFNDCIEAKVCPSCGHQLIFDSTGIEREEDYYYCTQCKFTYVSGETS